jgi:hypothetical protein
MKSAFVCVLILIAAPLVAGGPPPHAGPKKGGGTTFQIVDAQDQFVGFYFGSNSPLVREVAGNWLAFNWVAPSNAFFAVPAGPVRFESTDCSGIPYVSAEEPATFERHTYRLPADSRFYYGSGEAVTRVVNSGLLSNTCVQFTTTGSFRPLVVGFDPAVWIPPFRLVNQ